MAKIDDERIYMPTSENNHVVHAIAYAHALPYVRGKVVADLCCGTGYGTRLLSEAAKQVMGYDYSTEAIAYNITRMLPNVKYTACDVEKLSKLDVDVITCMQGLEHLVNPKKLISRFLDKEWVVALPNDKNDTNEYHIHRITPDLIQFWFNDKADIQYFDDYGRMSQSPFENYTNYFVRYQP